MAARGCWSLASTSRPMSERPRSERVEITLPPGLLDRIDSAGKDKFGSMWNRSAWFADLARRELEWQASTARAIELERQGLAGGASTRKGEEPVTSTSEQARDGSVTADRVGLSTPPASRRQVNPIPKGGGK